MDGGYQRIRLPEEKRSARLGRVISFDLVLISRDLNVEMSKLKLSDPKVTNNTAEKRTSQRATRSTSRQLKEVNVETDPESKTTDGHRSPGMWTPGMHTSPN
jgi:hypothetical protein